MTPPHAQPAQALSTEPQPPRGSDAPAGVPRSRRAAPVTVSELFGRFGLTKAAALIAAMLWFYWDHCLRLVRFWSEDPDWSHGFLIPVFSAYFVWSKRDALAREPMRTNWLGLPLLIFAIAAYFWSVRAKFGYPQALTIVIAVAGIVLLMCGWRVLKITGFAIAFLVLALPPPVRMYRDFTQPLQQFAAAVAELVLNFLPGVIVERSGINLAYERVTGEFGSFTVAGACSGMRSLMAFVALGLAMAYFAPRPVWHRVIIALVVVPVAVFCNIIRVVVTGTFQIYEYGNLAAGTPHTVLGLATFALGFAIYFGILYVLDHLYEDAGDETLPAGANP
ncbi:MAG: exosortase/archaeosortase family protein [Phycisphaerae bacterium]|nr:exosortase/archaeosortase family protein [Phycisphaerae bacterium]